MTGYDLVGLMVGSEGTLGVITEVTVRLLPEVRRASTALLPGAAVRTLLFWRYLLTYRASAEQPRDQPSLCG